MSAFVFRVVPLGPNWVIRSADDQVLHGYASRDQAWRVAQGAAEAMRADGRAAVVMMEAGPEEAAAA